MDRAQAKGSPLASRFIIVRNIFSLMGVRLFHGVVLTGLPLLTASCQGISVGLLIPLMKGMTGDFGFLQKVPVLNKAVSLFFALFPAVTVSHQSTFVVLTGFVFIFIALGLAMGYANNVLTSYWYGRFQRNASNYFFKRFLSFGKTFFDRTSYGYITLIFRYSGSLMGLLNMSKELVMSLSTLLIYLAIMVMVSKPLTCVVALVIPVYYFLIRRLVKKIQDNASQENQQKIQLEKKVFNVLSCIPLVKAGSKEASVYQEYVTANESLRKLDFKMARLQALVGPIQELIYTVLLLGIVCFVVLVVTRENPSKLPVFLVYFYMVKQLLPTIGTFNNLRSQWARLKPLLAELIKIMGDGEKFFIPEGDRIFTGLRDGLEFRGLSFSYAGGNKVLHGVSFRMERGKRTAIVGATGAGKTTLINLLVRFYDSPAGSILADGVDIREFTLKSLREQVALVSQDTFLFNDTLRANLTFGLERSIADEELDAVAQRARIDVWIRSLPAGWDTEIGDHGVKLSGGEKQRLEIARILLKGSPIFILDEATSSLDSVTECLIQEAMDEAAKGRTTIVIAHRLSTIRHADKIVVLEAGRVAEEGTLEALLAKQGRFFELWSAQKFQ